MRIYVEDLDNRHPESVARIRAMLAHRTKVRGTRLTSYAYWDRFWQDLPPHLAFEMAQQLGEARMILAGFSYHCEDGSIRFIRQQAAVRLRAAAWIARFRQRLPEGNNRYGTDR